MTFLVQNSFCLTTLDSLFDVFGFLQQDAQACTLNRSEPPYQVSVVCKLLRANSFTCGHTIIYIKAAAAATMPLHFQQVKIKSCQKSAQAKDCNGKLKYPKWGQLGLQMVKITLTHIVLSQCLIMLFLV
jgi:hypothetical protein